MIEKRNNAKLSPLVATLPLKILVLLPFFAGLLPGCAHTNFSVSGTPVSISEEWNRDGLLTWGGTKIFRIGYIEFGYLRNDNDATFIVDPGEKEITTYYYANRGTMNGFFYQTDLVKLKANLKPNGRYQVRVVPNDNSARFKLVDLDNESVVTESDETPVILRPSPGPREPVIIPIFIPAR